MTSHQINAPLPTFALPRLSGGTLSTNDVRGKKVLYFWWGSW